jgi:hypothetical protein
MDSKRILAELEAERARLDRAITAIEGISSDGAARPKAAKKGVRPRMSAAARKRISQARKLWWAKQKRAVKPRPHAKKAAPRPTAAKKASRNGGITAAGRKRLSEMMKKRWEERKKAKAASA